MVFLRQAGFSEIQAFNVNISLSACYIIGGIICWILFPHFGRATIYMSGMTIMFMILVVIGGLGFTHGTGSSLAIGILLVFSTLVNMITIGPVCYPIVAETPSGRLRYKTVSIGRFVYNLTGIFNNSVTPRMLSPIGMSPRRTGGCVLTDEKAGTGAQRQRSSTQGRIFFATSGASFDSLRRKIALSEKSICYLKTRSQLGNSSIQV